MHTHNQRQKRYSDLAIAAVSLVSQHYSQKTSRKLNWAGVAQGGRKKGWCSSFFCSPFQVLVLLTFMARQLESAQP